MFGNQRPVAPWADHNWWGQYDTAADLPNVAGARLQITEVQNGDLAFNLDNLTLYICLSPTAGAAVWAPIFSGSPSATLTVTEVLASPYNMLVTDQVLLVNVSPATILLPTAAQYSDRLVRVKDITGSASPLTPITVTPDGAETIDNTAGSFVIDNGYAAVNFLSDGSEWWVF